MAEPDCFASNHSLTANMEHEQQDKKDISKLFAVLRSKLNAKEKELLELQRAQPCLLAPDAEQIDALVNAISSLQLSTQDGCFLFPSTTSNGSSSTCACPSGVDTIKTLPATIWLPNLPAPVTDITQTHDHRLPMVSHLLSLPVSAYIASSSSSPSPSDHPPVPVQAKPEPCYRLPMVSQLLAMPINAFRSPSTVISQPTPAPVELKKEAKSNTKDNASGAESTKSIFQAEPTYSKEHWLRRTSSSSDSDYEHIPLDLDAYIEQSSSKMRRLHTEYLEAMAKLKSPAQAEDSAQAIKATYPQLFDRLQQDMSSRNPPHSSASKK